MLRLRRLGIASLAFACSLLGSSGMAAETGKVASAAIPSAQTTTTGPRIAPMGSRPYGRTYAEWAALWWQWGLQTPSGANPLTDTTGADCTAGQQGDVWFLAGNTFSILGTGPVVRSCKVPANTALLLPIVNHGYFAFLNDPPATRTPAFCRQQAEVVRTQQSLTLKVDGQSIGGLRNQFVRSELFDIQLPAQNILGLTTAEVPHLLFRPACDAGYYVLLYPLPSGDHVVSWTAPTGSQNITYNISIR